MHGHSSMAHGVPMTLGKDVSLLSYADAGKPLWTNESRIVLSSLESQGILPGDISDNARLRAISEDVTPNYAFQLVDHNGKPQNSSGYDFGFYLYDPHACVKLQHLEVPTRRNDRGLPVTSTREALGVAARSDAKILLLLGCKSGVVVHSINSALLTGEWYECPDWNKGKSVGVWSLQQAGYDVVGIGKSTIGNPDATLCGSLVDQDDTHTLLALRCSGPGWRELEEMSGTCVSQSSTWGLTLSRKPASSASADALPPPGQLDLSGCWEEISWINGEVIGSWTLTQTGHTLHGIGKSLIGNDDADLSGVTVEESSGQCVVLRCTGKGWPSTFTGVVDTSSKPIRVQGNCISGTDKWALSIVRC